MATDLHLMLRLRMSGAYLCSLIFSWHGHVVPFRYAVGSVPLALVCQLLVNVAVVRSGTSSSCVLAVCIL